MSTNQHTEASYENTLIQLFQTLGYAYECGYDVERDYRNPYYEEDLRDALQRLNPMLSAEVLNEAFRLVTHINEGTLEQRNETLMDYVQNGVEVKYSEDGRTAKIMGAYHQYFAVNKAVKKTDKATGIY